MSILSRFSTSLLVVILFAGSLGAAEPLPLADEWNEALKPLETMPVQDAGFVRSAYTFGDNHLQAISDRRQWRGLNALPATLWLMAHPEWAGSSPLIKLTYPDLIKLFGGKMISLEQWNDPALRERLIDLYERDQQRFERPVGELQHRAEALEQLEEAFAIVPRPEPEEWLSPVTARASNGLSEYDQKILSSWEALKSALAADKPAQAEPAAAALAEAVTQAAQAQGGELPALKMDAFYHRHHPFGKAAFFYLLATIGFVAALLGWSPGARLGSALLAVGLAEQILGTTLRWILAGRAPLSNMYESMTFAIGGLVLVAFVLELMWKKRFAGLGGGLLGFIFMVLAHKAPIFDSTIRPLMPALQSSWLTYHVITIMLSYSAFALSFFVALCYLVKDSAGGDDAKGLLGRLPTLGQLDLFNYKIIAIGFPLLTIGVILGAVWADTAWGRPWGFDPKETWSAITWLIYAIYLHARYLAGWQGRRTALLALLGFAAVIFTYLGVNFLLPGLHSYA